MSGEMAMREMGTPGQMGSPGQMGRPEQMGSPGQTGMPHQNRGHLYIQTNEPQNFIIHFWRAADGTITEVDRTATGGSGSGVFKPISGEESAPNAFEGADSVILSPDRVSFGD